MPELHRLRRWFERKRGHKAVSKTGQDLESGASLRSQDSQNNGIQQQQRLANHEPIIESLSIQPESVEPQSSSRLLALPAELRNQIYRYVLVLEPGNRVTLTPTRPNQPPLLCTSRQLRHEAIGIYFSENHFSISVVNYDLRPCIFVRKLNDKYRAADVKNCRYPSYGHRSWEDLRASLESLHAKPLPAGERRPKWCRRHEAVMRGVDILEKYRDAEWERVEEVLEGFHQGLIAENYGWI